MQVPQLVDAVKAHTFRYKKGQVPFKMLFSTNKHNHVFELPLAFCLELYYDVIIDDMTVPNVYCALWAHNNEYRKGQVHYHDIVRNCKYVVEEPAVLSWHRALRPHYGTGRYHIERLTLQERYA